MRKAVSIRRGLVFFVGVVAGIAMTLAYFSLAGEPYTYTWLTDTDQLRPGCEPVVIGKVNYLKCSRNYFAEALVSVGLVVLPTPTATPVRAPTEAPKAAATIAPAEPQPQPSPAPTVSPNSSRPKMTLFG